MMFKNNFLLVYLRYNKQILFYFLLNILEFSQVSQNSLAVVFNICSKVAWELQMAFRALQLL
jgi:hypothetical protein